MRRLASLGFIAVLALGAHAKASTIRGTVLDTEGMPVASDVTAYRLSVVQGNIQTRLACSVSADKMGRFVCRRLSQGAYVLLFSLHQPPQPPSAIKAIGNSAAVSVPVQTSYEENADSARIGHVPLVAFYPPLSDWQLSNLLHVGTGDTQFVSITVDNDTTSTLEAVPAQGFATGQVQIFASGVGFSVPLNMQVHVDSKDGYYLWQGLPAGQYKLTEVWGTGRTPHRAVRNVEVGISSTLTTSLAGLRSYSLSGSITPGSALLPPSKIILAKPDSPEHFAADISKGGSFHFNNIPAGRYDITFPLSARAAVDEALINGSKINDQSLEVNSVSSNGQLQIAAGRGEGSIAGTVELSGAEPHPGVVIESVASGIGMAVPVNKNGFFRISGLPVGSYLITGWSDLSKVPYNNSEFLSQYRSDATSASVDSSSGASSIDVSCNKSDI